MLHAHDSLTKCGLHPRHVVEIRPPNATPLPDSLSSCEIVLAADADGGRHPLSTDLTAARRPRLIDPISRDRRASRRRPRRGGTQGVV